MARFRMYPLRSNNVIQLYQWKDQINLEPPYQRIGVWNKHQQQSFIDSVINSFDIPKLYLHEIPPSSEQSSQYKYAVIDGKQRLLALWEFMSNRLPLPNDFVFFDDESIRASDATYEDLMTKFPRLRARFDSFDVPITIVQSDDADFIEQLFARLNIQVPLSAPEHRNALGGPLPYLIRKIGLGPFFKQSVLITNKRLQHYDLAAKFLYLTHVGAIESTHKGILNRFVIHFRNLRKLDNIEASDERLSEIENSTRAILDAMHHFFESPDHLLTSQGRTTLYFHIFRICQNIGQEIPFARQILAQFDEQVTAARKKSQRLATGSQEELTNLEQKLVYFDREKQSLNDAGAIRRQYDYMKSYFASVFNVQLPNTD